jgi:hypothetical protein
MSAVLVALFPGYPAAERVRTQLVKDGFPTDRVQLTATNEPGQAGLVPGSSQHAKFREYFHTLMTEEEERPVVEALITRIEQGAAAVAVHPRGDIETARAEQILNGCGAVEVLAHDLDSQGFERAAASHEGFWMRHLLPEESAQTS